jgi:hypothetical protein
MVTLPLYIFLFIYFGFLAVFTIFSLINFYHILTTGTFTFNSFVITFFVFALTVLTLYFTYSLLANIDWQTEITLFNSNWITNLFTF